ncbi:outer membrane protein assembly factor BamA [Desulfurispira natronophila]|uniref:Outer membrane protein assembly factor BamA n=1 Tax=Desulfurispira natronophila TaxID=682562 RepID=A0A7W7Y4I6_9BACT|nr:outer membrane protein assembly factor BamA [Desulfurispira natronophila]MBB5021672.1 outer membrane protein insertion porin family [Desulfurispira natronophila]
MSPLYRTSSRFMFRWLSLLLLTISFNLHAFATTIDVIETQGLRSMSYQAFLDRIQTQPGSNLNAETLSRDIRTLYQLEYFEDIKVYESQSPEGYTLTFEFTERPRVNSFSVEGNKRIRDEQIEGVHTISRNDIYSPELVARAKESIRQLYDTRGMQDVLITEEVTFREKSRTYDIVLHVDEGQRARIDNFIFDGGSYKRSEYYKYMENRERRWYSWITGRGNFSRVKAEYDTQRLHQFYLDRGYIDVHVSEPEYLLQESGNYIIRYEIEEGERYRIGSMNFRGYGEIATEEQIRNAMLLEEGGYFSSSDLHDSIVRITRLFADRGYANANVRPMDSVDREEHTVDFVFQVIPGEHFTIGMVDITGNNKTRDKVIRRQMRLLEGDEYSSSAVDESRRRLNNLRYFDELTIQERKTGEPGEMDIVVDVKEAPTGMFTLGIGYSTVDKVVGTTSLSQGNLMGRGQTLNFSLEKSSERMYYSLSFTEPFLFDRDINFTTSLYDQIREYSYYDDHRRGFSITLGRPLFDDVRGNIRYKYEEIDIKGVSDNASQTVKDMAGSSRTISITPSITRNTLDNRWVPTKGTRTNLYFEYAGGKLGGHNDFYKYGATHSIYHPLVAKLIGAVNVEARFVEGHSGQSEVPSYERLYMGGINSMRGYRFRDIGPKDPEDGGDSVGGYKSFLTNFELLYPLTADGNLRLVTFYDVGNVYDRGEDYLDSVLRSYGYGIRWLTPIGPLRLEYGRKVDREPGESRSRLDFTIGTMF